MSPSHGLVLACFVAVLNGPTALRLERGSISSGELAQRTQQAVPLECPWGKVQARGTATVEDESAAQEVCAPEVSDWQSEFAGFKNWSDALREAPLSASDIREQSMLGEAVRTLKQKSRQPHIAFIGDSLMRQQYFNLASWLIHGEARPEMPEKLPSIETHYHDFWTAVYRHQNSELQADGVSEICHCGRKDEALYVEDRFVALPANGSSMSFFGWFGDAPFHGYFTPPDERPTQISCKAGTCTSPFRWTIKQPAWQTARGVVQLLNSVVMKLQPKPTHVVVNSGKWGHLNTVGLRNLFAAGAEIQKRDGIRFMWKTVTHGRSDTKDEHQPFVDQEKKLAREYGWEVFDAYRMTSAYPMRGQYYRDPTHLSERATTHLNRMYLDKLLETLP
mmetsp:Transcript_49268/g.140695  ORF Transcript_49268/g.140695 Transcript_49268/m.140695 type:complete len:391 (-) Transcript_49268:12-1184(-)